MPQIEVIQRTFKPLKHTYIASSRTIFRTFGVQNKTEQSKTINRLPVAHDRSKLADGRANFVYKTFGTTCFPSARLDRFVRMNLDFDRFVNDRVVNHRLRANSLANSDLGCRTAAPGQARRSESDSNAPPMGSSSLSCSRSTAVVTWWFLAELRA